MEVGLLDGIIGKFPLSEEPLTRHKGRIQSIKEHLTLLLNARQGSVQHLHDYGLPDSQQISIDDRDSIAAFGKHIEELVRKYEPRLTQVRVRSMEQDQDSIAEFKFGFILEAKVVNQNTKFQAIFSNLGAAEVKGEDTL